jgi:hypothetical protein
MTEYADLSGASPGLILVPGNATKTLQYAPGYSFGKYVIGDTADYMDNADMVEALSVGTLSPSGIFYNLAMHPGVQKWKPTHRYGQITAIDYEAHTCSVSLEAAYDYHLDLNQTYTLTAVPIKYMT